MRLKTSKAEKITYLCKEAFFVFLWAQRKENRKQKIEKEKSPHNAM